MAENSKIEWTHHTFNPWWGCAKVSPGCDHCYAERDAGRFTPNAILWGVDAERREFGDKHWDEPRKWNAKAAKEGTRYRVFCASMADVFDKNAPAGARERLFELIKATPHLDWLLLTKRIGNAKTMLPADWGNGYPNVWLGASIVNREEMLRDGPKLKVVPAMVTFWSSEPLLGDLGEVPRNLFPDWVVVGGESGPNARAMHPDWARKLRDQCAIVGVPFLFKQWGEWAPVHELRAGEPGIVGKLWHNFDPDTSLCRVGKKAAGRLLDGVQHDGYPKQAA